MFAGAPITTEQVSAGDEEGGRLGIITVRGSGCKRDVVGRGGDGLLPATAGHCGHF